MEEYSFTVMDCSERNAADLECRYTQEKLVYFIHLDHSYARTARKRPQPKKNHGSGEPLMGSSGFQLPGGDFLRAEAEKLTSLELDAVLALTSFKNKAVMPELLALERHVKKDLPAKKKKRERKNVTQTKRAKKKT